MTSQEMQYSFEIKFGVFHTLEKPFTSTDIALFLNKAQKIFVNNRYSNLIGNRGEYFESSEKARTELGSLIKNYNTGTFDTSDSALHSSAVFVSLPSDYLYAIKEMCVVSYTDCNSTTATATARILPIRHDEYQMKIDDPFSKPDKKTVWRMDYGITGSKKHELFHGALHTITSYSLRYLKQGTDIDIINGVDCELHPIVHEEIVDMAVSIAMASLSQTQEKSKVIE